MVIQSEITHIRQPNERGGHFMNGSEPSIYEWNAIRDPGLFIQNPYNMKGQNQQLTNSKGIVLDCKIFLTF